MSIGGVLDYARLAQLNRPTDPSAIAAEVRRLAAEQRLTANDIATALRINSAQVRAILAAPANEAAALHAQAWRA